MVLCFQKVVKAEPPVDVLVRLGLLHSRMLFRTEYQCHFEQKSVREVK